MSNERSHTGTLTLDPPVDVREIPTEYNELARAVPFAICTEDGVEGLTFRGLDLNDSGWCRPRFWDNHFTVMERIARSQRRTLISSLRWNNASHHLGSLIADRGGLLHDVPLGDDPDEHRNRRCTCYRSHGDDAARWAVHVTTADPTVRVLDYPAGPFTDQQVMCDQHAEVAYTTTRQKATYLRELHLLQEHTIGAVPLLGTTDAAAALGTDFTTAIAQAADELRNARGRGGDMIASRARAQEYANQAVAAIQTHRTDAAEDIALHQLVTYLVEQSANHTGACPG